MPRHLISRLLPHHRNVPSVFRCEYAMLIQRVMSSKSSRPEGTRESPPTQAASPSEKFKWRMKRRVSLSPELRLTALSEGGEDTDHKKSEKSSLDECNKFTSRLGTETEQNHVLEKRTLEHDVPSDMTASSMKSVQEHIQYKDKRHLSPLKRYSGLMSEEYLKEVTTVEKENLEAVLKTDKESKAK